MTARIQASSRLLRQYCMIASIQRQTTRGISCNRIYNRNDNETLESADESTEGSGQHDNAGSQKATDFHEEDHYDVVIAGGGMVGAAMACALGTNPVFGNKKILVLESAKSLKTDFASNMRYSNRVSSITPGSRKMLETIGAWKDIEEMRYKPYSLIHVWDACGAGSITFDAEEVAELQEAGLGKNLAYIIENQVLLSALYRRLSYLRDLVRIQYGQVIQDISSYPQIEDRTSGEFLHLAMSDGKSLKTKLLVAADGANSSIRNKLGMKFVTSEYGQSGVVATLQLEKPSDNNTAWQRFLPTGPIAALPLSETRSSLVWSTLSGHARELVNLPEDRFVDAVNNAFWEDNERHPLIDYSNRLMQDVVGTLNPGIVARSKMLCPPAFKGVSKGSRAAFPLGIGHAVNYVRRRVALVGDAAHRVHPLAGQGVNLGFADALCLANVLAEHVEIGEDIGNLECLHQYETTRQRDVLPMMAAIDSLKRLFSTDYTPVVLARSLGLQATNALTPLKEQIMRFAMK